MLQRRKFSVRRNASKRWHKALQGSSPPRQLPTQKTVVEPLSVAIKRTNMNIDEQKQQVEIANFALDTCGIENEIATSIKKSLDGITGMTWHVIVGRNFGSHVSYTKFIEFSASKITILVFQCG
uniref:Dynein light chain n=1 Tax=Panagrolaimus sp. JU765 TaxID=591449 RepID=A0AC34QGG9_9BILA